MNYSDIPTDILTLGEAKIPSEIRKAEGSNNQRWYVSDSKRVLIDVDPSSLSHQMSQGYAPASFELAGPRKLIYFDPSKLRCALVTCGGLCPGLNDIIRSVVLELYFGYGVRNIAGIRHGLQGLIPSYGHDVVDLTPESVADITAIGGSILGSSRGPQPVEEIVDTLVRMNVGILFMIGGDGTTLAAEKIADAVNQRGLKISIVGIPKTIDNDIFMVSRSFGFDTAVDVATQAIKGANREAEGYPNGIGLIKLMGRHSGFIAATAVLSQQDVNFVLIPEIDFDLEGEQGFLRSLENRLEKREHAVVVVAEGAGQKFFQGESADRDESGNLRLQDIGMFLKSRITQYFKENKKSITLKYIDPSYMIRSVPANANDRAFCSFLGRDAVHAGMAGKTRLLIGYWNDTFVHIPLEATAGKRKQVNPKGRLWQNVLDATGQTSLKNED
jgi:6-phosphofructokinase 1